jgi:hypothetical protein
MWSRMRAGRLSFGAKAGAATAVVFAVLFSVPRHGAEAAAAAARVVAVGDIHGDVAAFKAILEQTGLVDGQSRWTGGNATLVQTGDYLDRGAGVREVLDLLMALEDQAKAASGRAITLLGNHETMNLTSEVRDVSPEAYASFVDERSEERRQAAFEAHQKLAAARREAFARTSTSLAVPNVYREQSREEWMAARPPGMIEYIEAFGPQGHYGRWLRRRDLTVRVGDTVFLHGGFNPQVAPKKLSSVNDQAEQELAAWDRMRKIMLDERMALPSFTFQELLEAGRSELDRVVVEARTKAQAPEPPDAFPSVLVGHPLTELLRLSVWSIINTNGPVWFRGFATWSPEEGARYVDELQRRYGRVRFVVGHTMPATLRITARFSSRVFLIDTGMLSSYYKGGRASALEISGDTYTAITLEDRKVLVSPTQ